MNKATLLKSIGFSNEFIEKINEYDQSAPQISNIRLDSGLINLESYRSQDLTIMQDPETAYSNVIIES